MTKVSVIIPIYKVEKYIEKCVRSLFEQTYSEMEYIFVDDCSPDNSISILKRVLEDYPFRKKQLKIIRNNKNLGSACVRNIGLKAASGDYIGWVDADDWADLDMFQCLVEKAIDCKSEVVICDYYEEWTGQSIEIKQSINNSKILPQMFNRNKTVSWALWNKLFEANLIKKFDFVNNADMGEDMMIVVSTLLATNKVSYLNKSLYHYNRSNLNSLVNNWSKDKILQLITNTNNLEINAKRIGVYSRKEISKIKLISKYHLLDYHIADYKLWRELYPEANYYILCNNYFSVKAKIIQAIVWFRLNFLYKAIMSIKN
ncbi:glycosyltransferase family 2 protein [Marinifilum flexuosum]|uniref:Glycosyltransferase involved in cell wall biosynthesis n=1 Tax=Marinifilum flexuosum TaxID=1117708 RepID=A0A419XA29_9BACT|nr:glycosyltransferase family 2 protein [Marinifilum flexuosum]RKE04601.1 glycosyltransferase involved in cell wall biosynthesis [Marinifilum flexuosum]